MADTTVARQTKRPKPEDGPPLVSVIVPVRNEEAFIGRTLDGLLSQQFPASGYEILVVDGRSTDGTRQVVLRYAQQHGNLRLLDNPKGLSSAARNVGARAARGQLVVVVDGHCEIRDRHYLANLTDAFRRSGADCLGRPQPLDVESATALQRAIAAARSSSFGHHPSSYIYATGEAVVPAHSVAVAYRRGVFDQIGYFDETFDACEDVEFNHRLDRDGLRCFFTDAIQVRYVPRRTLGALFHQMVRYGRGRARLLRKHPDTLTIGTLLPGLFVLGCLLGAALMWVATWLTLIYLAAIGLYLTALVGVSVLLTVRNRDARILLWLPLVFLAIHVGAGTGILFESLAPVRRPPRVDHAS